ncbi:MAG: hypothetical protein LBK00_03665 [Treponema sp.]|nr:hypothetical protein [Treponema sp.]
MKRSLFLISALCIMCVGLYAEDEPPQTNPAFPMLPPLVFDITNQGDFLSMRNFLLLDGTYLNYTDMRERLLAIPGNETYLNRAKGFEIGSVVSLGVGAAGAIAYLVFALIPDMPNQDILKFSAWSGLVLGICGSAVSFTYSYANLREATRNYNLSIMGIPVPTKK